MSPAKEIQKPCVGLSSGGWLASAKELSFKISAYVGRSLQTFEQTHYEYVKVSVPLC